MFGNRVSSLLRIGNIISGLNRGLNVMNELIPTIKKVKPMVENSKELFNKVKEFGNKSVNKMVENSKTNMQPVKEKINTIKSVNLQNSNTPTFFQ